MCIPLGPYDTLCCKVSVAPIVNLSDVLPSSRLIFLSQPLIKNIDYLCNSQLSVKLIQDLMVSFDVI